MIMEENFIKYIEQSIKDHWDLPALTDFKGATSSVSYTHLFCQPEHNFRSP